MSYDPFAALVNSQYRDALYGASYKGDLSNVTGFKTRDKTRDKTGDAVASYTEQLLKQMYPNATQEQLDQAAYQALTTQGQGPNVRVMWEGKLADRRGGFEKAGLVGYNSQANPYDIARRIGSYMGGVSPEMEAQLAQSETAFMPTLKKWEGGIDAADTKANGIGGLGGALLGGALTWATGGLLGPVAAGALGGAVGSAAASGDPNKALKGAVLGGMGGYAANQFGWNPQPSGGGVDPNSFAFSDGASLGTATPNFDIAGQGLLANVAPQLPSQTPSMLDKAWDWAKSNPTTAMKLASGAVGGLIGAASTPSGGGGTANNIGKGGYQWNHTPFQFQQQQQAPQYTGGLLFGPK